MKIRDIEFDFDFLDANDMERFENEAKKITEICQNNSIKSLSYSDAIREECKIIDNFFDKVFGEGAAQKIFKGKMNLNEHIFAFKDIVDEKVKKQQEFKNLIGRYKPNRKKNKEYRVRYEK